MTESQDFEKRLVQLEQAVRSLQAVATESAPRPDTSPESDTFWALEALAARSPEGGAVLYTGSVELPTKGLVQWQYGLGAKELFEQDWSEQADKLAALGHPVRLSILQAVLNGETTVAKLVEKLDTGTSGQIYHHLKELISTGWLVATRRGSHEVPPAKIVPLLAILLAAGTSE
jgi:DNA-binding transcriptional ArsR family regulator